MTTWRLRLRPTSPWATPWHADSLFGALAWRCAEAYGEDALLKWIAGFQSGDPPFLLSDALPGDWFPAPLGPAYKTPAGDKAKIPVWVDAADFQRMLQDPEFGAPASLSGGEKSSHADRRQASRDRATDRTDTEGGALFEVEQQILSEDSGGFFSLYIRTETPDVLTALVDLLSVTGFGKKCSTGLGSFELDGNAELYPGLDNYAGANGFVSLSHFVPAASDPARGAWRTHVSYPKYHGSSVKHPFKGRLVQLTPGSCFHTASQPRPWYGRAVRAGCGEFPEAIQYGFAFAVPAVMRREKGSNMSRRLLADVFITVGLPPYTYVRPSYYGEVRADIEEPGKHLLIEGPSGVGKTCVVCKVFEEIGWRRYSSDPNRALGDEDYGAVGEEERTLDAGQRYSWVSARDEGAEPQVSAFLEVSNSGRTPFPSVLVIDDFHLFPVGRRATIGSQLKRLSDRVFEGAAPPKVILIGIPTTGNSLVSDAYDLGPRLGTYRLTRATDSEIDRLIAEGESALNVLFDDRSSLLTESAGNFWLAQHICKKICATAEVYQSAEDTKILSFDLLGMRQRLMVELSQRYMPVARAFAKGKKWRPGGNKPYLEVLLALASLPDLVVTYDTILRVVPEQRRPGLRAIRQRIPEVICDPSRGVDLRKQIAFDPDSGFSLEDPLFRYFLSNLNHSYLYKDLGIEVDELERARKFHFDVGFSFAGETRRIVEAVNEHLKAEEISTFYDFDQQAVLLALDLEETLGRVYAKYCQYYLVFLDEHYLSKVWTKYEKDILTHSGRKDHIVPVVLDEIGAQGAAGIASTICRIDLRDLWSEVVKSGRISEDVANSIRNRCVVPLIERLGSPNLF